MQLRQYRVASRSSAIVSGRPGRVKPVLLSSLAALLLSTAAHAQTVELPTVRVETTSGESGTGRVTGYVASQSVTSTKTNTPVLETPQTISIVTKDQIEAQQAHTVVEALRYTPAVTLDLYGANSAFDGVWLRGFQALQYLDGLKLPFDPGTQFAVPRIEPYGLERLEVLKGPSSGLYGQTNPGGFLNMVSKRPTATKQYEFQAQTGSFDRIQGSFDLSGPVDKNGQFLYRLTGLVRDSDSQLDYVTDNKVFIAPSFTWRPTTDTSFTVLSSYQKIDNKGYQQYVPAQGSLLPNPNGTLPYNRYLGEPSLDGYRQEQWMLGYALDHRFNDVFQFRQNARYFYVQNDLTGVRSEGLQGDLQTLNRSINYVSADSSNIAIDNQLQADFRTGPLKHTALFGLDYLNVKSHSDYRFAMINPINIFNPVYGNSGAPTAASLAPFVLRDDKQTQLGAYVQDQIKLDRFTLSLTGRHDWATTESESMGGFPPPGTTSRDDKAFTGRAGLTYLFDFGLAPYVSYSTSFIPLGGTDVAGNTFKPTTGEGYEAGVKYQPTGINLLITAAFFDITQQNVLTADPSNLFFSVQTGEARVKGFEFEVRGNVTRELEVIAGYAKLDPRITQDTNFTGNYMVNTALETASLWGMYTWQTGPLAGFGIGAGVRYTGESYGDAANTIRITPYTLYDAALSYDFKYANPRLNGWKAQLNVTNLTDKYYVASCLTGLAYCGVGSSRTALFTLKYAMNEK